MERCSNNYYVRICFFLSFLIHRYVKAIFIINLTPKFVKLTLKQDNFFENLREILNTTIYIKYNILT